MRNRFVGPVVVLFLGFAGHAGATCSTLPYSFSNGTTADANQVMADLNCLSLLGGSHYTGQVLIFGASAPGLEIDGAPATLRLKDSSAGVNWDLGPIAGSNNFTFNNNGGSVLNYSFINGRVGINTSSPTLLFQVNGAAGGSSAWQTVSDARLKKSLQPVTDGLSRIVQLRQVRYQWRSTSERSVGRQLSLPEGEIQIGFVAQEVSQVVPEAVSKGSGADGIYTLKMDNLIPILVAAIIEQKGQISTLKARVDALTKSGAK